MKKNLIIISVITLTIHQFFFYPYALLFLKSYFGHDAQIESDWTALTYRESAIPKSFGYFDFMDFKHIKPTMHFKQNGELVSGLCNTHFGRYSKDMKIIKVALLSSTYKSCSPALNAVEQKFVSFFYSQRLGDYKTYEYKITGQILQLYDPQNKNEINLIIKNDK